MIKLLILGPSGFTSKLITSMALQDEEIDVIAACDISKIGEELGDIFFTLVCLANHYEIDLEKELMKIIEKYTKRDSKRFI
ncbi:MAG: MazG nucleotide pyrophosphohydrolase domain-containing protein [Candidatus Lokiarchaeota archaeon]